MSANGDLLTGREAIAMPARRKRRVAKAPVPSEGQVVTAIINRLKLYGCTCQANPNEARSAATGRSSKIAHTVLGFPDLTVIGPEGRVAFLEVKRPGAKPSGKRQMDHWARQAETRALLSRLGQTVGLVTSQDEACAVLRAAGWRV